MSTALLWIWNHYFFFSMITVFIGCVRAYRGRQAFPLDPLDVIFWILAWPIVLPTFIVRWMKYRFKGKRL